MNVAFVINFLGEKFKVMTMLKLVDVNKKSPAQKKMS